MVTVQCMFLFYTVGQKSKYTGLFHACSTSISMKHCSFGYFYLDTRTFTRYIFSATRCQSKPLLLSAVQNVGLYKSIKSMESAKRKWKALERNGTFVYVEVSK